VILAQAVDPNDARRAAQNILRDRRFHHNATPRPLRGPLEWLGDRLQPIGDWLGRVFGAVPGWIWLGLAGGVVAIVLARVVVISRRRRVSGEPHDAWSSGTGAGSESADALERAADAAERDGDLERALRLRFRAGLIRLGDRGAIEYRSSVTTGEVRRALGSGAFEKLAGTFEEVTYGGREADASDLDASRRDWPRVLEESSRR
jgi:hypothetical protein